MPKLRVEFELDLPKRTDKTVQIVEASYPALLNVAKNKFKLKTKDLANIALYAFDNVGDPFILPHGDLTALLRNGSTVMVMENNVQPPAPRISKTLQSALQELEWVPAGAGQIAARGCPNPADLAALQQVRGLSGVITLLREGEKNCAAERIGTTCGSLDMRSWHAPLNGIGSILRNKLSPSDLASFDTTSQVRHTLLQGNGNRFIVHCSAGLHRTSMYIYVLLRRLGDSPDAAVQKIQATRKETHAEFVRLCLQPLAEQILEQLEPGLGDPNLLQVASTENWSNLATQVVEDEEED